ncbi:MAG: phenylalanine--tRNA ligase subunit beta, partial [Methylophaga sp.]|nr:phenylalanine--tRNA ligase subunit beta [Methylophaga sp.]
GQPGPVVEQSSAADLPKPVEITLRADRIKRVLGISLPDDDVAEKLSRLGLQVTATESGWKVVVPSFRFDLAIEVDLIEELGRLYGYDKLPQTRPQVNVLSTSISEHQLQSERLQNLLVDRGYFEAITYSFVDPQIHQHFASSESAPIALANPISADLSVMRQSLWPGLVQALSYNLNRQQDRVRLFEIGRVFNGDKSAIEQQLRVGGLIYGDIAAEQWSDASRKVDFYDAKADVEALLKLANGEVTFVAEAHPALHPGQSARIIKNGHAIGWLGALHPKLNKPLDINGKVFVFEMQLSAVLSAQVPEFSGVSRYPAIRRDLALVVEQTITAGQIEHCLKSIDSDILKAFQLFDVYTGDGVEQGKKSLAIAFRIQHDERTLTDDEVDALMTQIRDNLQSSLGAVIRA